MSTKETKLKIKRRQEGLTQREIAKTPKSQNDTIKIMRLVKACQRPIQPS